MPIFTPEIIYTGQHISPKIHNNFYILSVTIFSLAVQWLSTSIAYLFKSISLPRPMTLYHPNLFFSICFFFLPYSFFLIVSLHVYFPSFLSSFPFYPLSFPTLVYFLPYILSNPSIQS